MTPKSVVKSAFACVACHNRKVRCVPDVGGTDCRACRNANIECVPRTRKKRANTVSTTARRTSTSPSRAAVVTHTTSSTLPQATNLPNSIVIPANHSTSQTPLAYSAHTDERFEQNCSPGTATPQPWVHPHADTFVDRRPLLVTTDVLLDDGSNYAVEHPPPDPRDATLELWQSFDVPPRSVRQNLTNLFLEYIDPWLPVLEQTDLASLARIEQQPAGILLAQALWFAASCISSSSIDRSLATSAQFYGRVKALFFSGRQSNLLVVIKATLMMQCAHWDDPDQVSFDDHQFWLTTAITLAFRVGLNMEVAVRSASSIRRRLWWTMVAQDALMALAYDRPRIIKIDESKVQELRELDFVASTVDWDDFVIYIDIARILGDLSDCQRCRTMTYSCRSSLENRIYHCHSRLYRHEPTNSGTEAIASRSGSFNTRQLKVAYFTALTLFSCRDDSSMGQTETRTKSRIPITAIVAASMTATIFRTYLERDEIRYLAPIFTIHAFTGSMALLSLWSYPDLWEAAQTDVQILRQALSGLSRRRHSPNNAIEALDNALSRMHSGQRSNNAEVLSISDHDFCRKVICSNDLNCCRLWKLITQLETQKTASPSTLEDSCYRYTAFRCSCHAKTAQRLESNLPAHKPFAYERFEHWILHGG